MIGDIGDRPFRPVLEALELLLAPGAVAELRAIGRDGRIASGYFDDPAKLATAAEVLDDAAECSGIYVTLNPVHPALLSRRANRVQTRLGRKDATTADADIVRRRWLPIDIDPVRPSGVSASAEEHHAACATARTVREALAAAGWPAPVVADSGNGGHLLYRIDLPSDDESTALVKAVLAALDARFSTAGAKVDTANFNAARIWKVYGTVGRKGDSTKDRAHRRSAVVARPYEIEVVPVERLRALAAPPPPPGPPSSPLAAPAPRPGGIDLGAWLREHGVGIAAERPWQGGTLHTLAQCPFSDAHADGAYATQFPNGAIHVGCKHDSCGGGRQRWQELRARLEPVYAGRPAVEPAHPAAPSAVEPAHPPPPPPGSRDGMALPSVSPSPPQSEGGIAPSPEVDPAVVAAAKEVLETGDPVRYFLDCFGEDHVGDATLARCLVLSIASQTVRNSRGLHVYVTGESGKGKSSGMTAMLRQVPRSYRLAERMSNKALYYSDDISAGTVLLLDDIALSEELQEVLKEATTKFTERVRMRVVTKDRTVRHCTIPERCAWWLANVSALYEEQVLNRMLICWVDDSEEQDREVYRRKLEDEDRPPDEAIGDRFELRVCREMWWLLKEQGLVHVRIPFARRVRMASVRNRRNADVLFDLVRAHALVNLFRRERRTLADGRLALVATEEDFRAAAAVFAELHAAGGSLTSKFDRNEEVVLDLASRYRAGEFAIGDVQRWTGWTYSKARRVLMGHVKAGTRYPGLLDKSPALSVIDRTVSDEDGEGRAATRRQHVFVFDPEIYRETRASALVWLEAEPAAARGDDRCTSGAHGGAHIGAHPEPGASSPVGGSEATGQDSVGVCALRGDTHADACVRTEGATAPARDRCDPDTGAHSFDDLVDLHSEIESKVGSAAAACAPDSAPVCPPDVHRPDGCTSPASGQRMPFLRARSVTSATAPGGDDGIDPRRFVPTGSPDRARCARCGAAPTFHRERRGDRRLCKQCFARIVERERRRCPPLPAVIDPAALRRAAADNGRCDVCDMESARWHGSAGRLCDACYEREVRRGIGRGETPAAA